MKTNEKGIKKLRKLLRKERTVADLSERLDVHRRTVYRWLDELESRGLQVSGSVSRPTKYRIS